MQKELLFTNATVNQQFPEIRPDAAELARSPLEEYVLGEMPADLRAIHEKRMTREELSAKQAALLEELGPQIAMNQDPDVAKLTQLDLLFMFGGHIPAGKDMYRSAPPALLGLISEQCDRFSHIGLRPYMTYEMIVDFNAAEYARTGNMRVYADGPDGEQERDFYLGHHVAEPYAKAAAYQLRTLADQPDKVNATALLENAVTNLRTFGDYMKAYGRLPKDTFNYFRIYLSSYADGTRNASGAFMPSVQLLELATMAPTDMYDVYLDESHPYFPDWAAPVIQEWRTLSASGINIEDRLATGSLELDDQGRTALNNMLELFLQFRMTHLGITKAQIPEAFSTLDGLHKSGIVKDTDEKQILAPDYKGTAGFDVRNVLTNSVVRLANLQRRLGGSAVSG